MSTNPAHIRNSSIHPSKKFSPGLPSRPGRVSEPACWFSLRRVYRRAHARRVVSGLPRCRRHHRRDLRMHMVLHEHKASPQSQPRTWRTGFSPELLSTPFPFPVLSRFKLHVLTARIDHPPRLLPLLTITSHAQGNTGSSRPWTLFAARAQVPRALTRAPRAPSNPALCRWTHRIVILTAHSTARYPRAKSPFTQRTVQ